MSAAASSPQISKRSLVFVLIVLLHIGFFWALNSGLSHSVIDVVFGPIETRIIEEQKVIPKEPPPPPPEVKPPPPDYIPPPDLAIELPPAENTSAIQNITSQKPVERAAPPPSPSVPKTLPKSDSKHPLSQPEYPPTSRRLGEAGTVVLDVYVLENGRVGDARVKKSSGFERLDQAAVNEVKRSWRLTPGTEEGKPVAMWGQFAITFKLTD